MKGTSSIETPIRFQAPEEMLGDMDAQIAAKVIAAAADIALIIDRQGIIRDVSFGESVHSASSYKSWLDRPWVETVTIESKAKVEQILREAFGKSIVRSREINQTAEGAPDLPVRYSAVRLATQGRVLAVGRDLRAVASLQQQLVSTQQSMEREYARLRHEETRYRLLFQIASEGVLIVNAGSYKIAEINPVASKLIKETPQRSTAKVLSSIFPSETWPLVQRMLSSVEVAGSADEIDTRLVSGREITLSASLFRQANGSFFLIRLTPTGGEQAPNSEKHSQLLEVISSLPEAFVVIDGERRVQTSNAAFVDLVRLATQHQVVGEKLDRWFGRPGVDLNILMAHLNEHGAVRNFATVVRDEYGLTEEAEISGVAATHEGKPCFGFVIRSVASRFQPEAPGEKKLPQSVEQLTSLVGRVALKEIVRETTDLIERLCIEAALEVAGDNRASAAQILGLSRQSLYAKLRRHNLGDLENEGDA